MLKTEALRLSPRVNLTCARTDKFKTACLSVTLVTGLHAEAASKNALLPRVLRRGSSGKPDIQSLAAELDTLYGAQISPLVRKKGELQCVGFVADFIDDDFVPRSERVLERVCALLGELLLSPRTHGGLLAGDYVDGERQNLIDDIRAGVNDKIRYAPDQLVRNMCAAEAFGVHRLGSEETARAITAQKLTNHYRSLLAASRVEIFYGGMAEASRVELAVREAFAPLLGSERVELPATQVLLAPEASAARRFSEALDVAQGKLCLGFRLGEVMRRPDYPAFSVFNAVFGGSVTSKLFLNVRERLSLCYYASSMIEKHKGVLLVNAGVAFADFDRAEQEILAQLDAIRQGDLSDTEFTAAKRAVMTDKYAELDDLRGLEAAYFDHAIARVNCPPDAFAALADAVTKEQVIAVAQSAVLDSVYRLAGKEGA